MEWDKKDELQTSPCGEVRDKLHQGRCFEICPNKDRIRGIPKCPESLDRRGKVGQPDEGPHQTTSFSVGKKVVFVLLYKGKKEVRAG